jgi:alpha-L-fucosidase
MREDVIAFSKAGSEARPQWLEERLRWFQAMKFGIIVHWGIYSFWDCCESWPLVPDDDWARQGDLKCWAERNRDIDLFQRDYWNLIEQFNPIKFDPDQWADSFATAGAKYVCFTTKHHDGFCLWDTATTDYKITGPRCPYRTNRNADVTLHLFEALRRAGLAVSVYFSKADWHCPYYWAPEPRATTRGANTVNDPEIWERFVQYTHQQIRELMSNYGPVDILWLDAGWVRDAENIRMPELVEMARKLQPGLIVANRTVGDFEDFVTPEREVPESALTGPWEACLPLGANWKYVEGEPYRPTEEVIKERQTINGRGGNFLLGIGPKPDGSIPNAALAALREIGRLRGSLDS